ncbi:MAG: Gfo/Idh/MocA family oxidoreductase [Verrucomicrobiae bacterium]|nr:Gfo/Idh/MocA family oxidoreductase [Verrucomicrobiae bacterium]
MNQRSVFFSRRDFLRVASSGVFPAPLVLRSGARAASPNSKLNHACIGVGGMGWGDLQNFLKHERVQIVALCDVDAKHLKKASDAVPGARAYRDWRELLEKEGDKIDSLNVTVPDHMHFPIAYSAIMRGKHVYCQKPMCHDVAEVRALTNAAIKKRVCTQLGTQAASGIGDRMAVQFLRDGVVGKIKHAYLCSNRPGAVENYRLAGPRPARGEEPPAHLDWDLWLGTAPTRPYAPGIYHPVKWRAWLDFGTGWSGDIGCHIFDHVWKGLDLKAPTTIVAEVQESWKKSPERRADNWPQGDHITWTFPGNKLIEGKELTVEWFDGEFYPPKDIMALNPSGQYPPESAMLVGTEGAMLVAYSSGPLLLPLEKFKSLPRPKLPPRNHYHHFVDACLGREKNESHFAQTGPMTEAILLGTVAVRCPDQTLKWNAAGMKITNCPGAQRLLKRRYRDGWEIAGV